MLLIFRRVRLGATFKNGTPCILVGLHIRVFPNYFSINKEIPVYYFKVKIKRKTIINFIINVVNVSPSSIYFRNLLINKNQNTY